ncbi:MAG: DedA family protein [Desulfuromonadales bacterium]|nr:DedA family protein [Desulfuromonadales bacterium]
MSSKIINTVRTFRWQQWLVVSLFLLFAGFTVFKAVDMTREAIYWKAHRDEAIRGWMSVGYVAHSYRVQPDELYLALGLPDKQPDKRPLRKIAHMQHRSMDEIRAALQGTIIHARSPAASATSATPRTKSRSMGAAMSLIDQLLAAFLLYGQPALFGLIVIAAIGAPLPVNLMLVAAGSFVEQGEMKLWLVVIVASTASVLGDQIGYGLARWGGRRLVARISRTLGGEDKIKKAEALAKRWGGPGIFFSRWLVTSLGPWLNVTSGIAEYPWRRFIIWAVLGDVLWVVLYVMLGYIFSDRVQAIAEVLGYLAWIILGLIAAGILGWKLMQYLRTQNLVNA